MCSRGGKKPSAREPARAVGSKAGSFSSVSRPLIARVGAFFSILRDLQNLHSFAPVQTSNFQFSKKFRKKLDGVLLKFCDLSGAQECQSSGSSQILKNAPTLAIVAVHAAENEPPNFSVFVDNLNSF